MEILIPRDHSINLLCCPSSQDMYRCTRDFSYYLLLPLLSALAYNRPKSLWRAWLGLEPLLIWCSSPFPSISNNYWLSISSQIVNLVRGEESPTQMIDLNSQLSFGAVKHKKKWCLYLTSFFSTFSAFLLFGVAPRFFLASYYFCLMNFFFLGLFLWWEILAPS